MKKASKILTLILIVVFVLSVFAGCDLVGRDVAKYRSTTAMKIGNQDITIGKLLDTFNNYYNNYYYYISAGYFDAEDLLEMAIDALLQQYVQVDDYVSRHSNDVKVKNSPLKNLGIKNAEYLDEAQFSYCIKYVKHSAFTALDSTVMTTLSAKHDIGDEKTEDTSRDFPEYDDLHEAKSYAEYLRDKNFISEEADEYFDKYYKDGSVDFTDINKLVDGYVYTETTADEAQAILDELNDRLEDEDDEITFDEYVDAQSKAVRQLKDTVKNNYGTSLDNFLRGQVEDMVSSCIIALWNYEKYVEHESDIEDRVNNANLVLSNAQKAEFEISDNFDSFITGLSDDKFIYNVPEDMLGKYVFVKNILIPFSDAQKEWLKEQAPYYGGEENDSYIELRNREAAEIVAEYFDSDKYDTDISALFSKFLHEDEDEDAESKYEKIENVFKLDEQGNIAINLDSETGVLAPFFTADGNVISMEKDGESIGASKTIVELMKRFNTDTAQHSSRYDYVVYVGNDWEDYSHSWVKEFYSAVNNLRSDPDGDFDGTEKYAICVSTYGVHIIYVEGFVEDSIYDINVDWSTAWKDTSSLDYVRYKAEYDNQVSILTKAALEKLQTSYLEGNKITVNKQFKRFLKNNDFVFNFDEYLKEKLAEL